MLCSAPALYSVSILPCTLHLSLSLHAASAPAHDTHHTHFPISPLQLPSHYLTHHAHTNKADTQHCTLSCCRSCLLPLPNCIAAAPPSSRQRPRRDASAPPDPFSHAPRSAQWALTRRQERGGVPWDWRGLTQRVHERRSACSE
jgi:hypothetical protein